MKLLVIINKVPSSTRLHEHIISFTSSTRVFNIDTGTAERCRARHDERDQETRQPHSRPRGEFHSTTGPQYGEEWGERALLGFTSCSIKESGGLCTEVEEITSWPRRAWTVRDKLKELAVTRLMEIAALGNGPEKAARKVTRVVRKSREKVAQLQNRRVFVGFF